MTNSLNSRSDAAAALVAFQASRAARNELSGDDRENLTDLVTDLLHLVDTDPTRFDGYDGGMIADKATDTYYEERDEPDDDLTGRTLYVENNVLPGEMSYDEAEQHANNY